MSMSQLTIETPKWTNKQTNEQTPQHPQQTNKQSNKQTNLQTPQQPQQTNKHHNTSQKRTNIKTQSNSSALTDTVDFNQRKQERKNTQNVTE